MTNKTPAQWRRELPLIGQMMDLEEALWFNPGLRAGPAALADCPLTAADVADASARLRRFAPYLAAVFPDAAPTGGIIESPLVPIPAMQARLGDLPGRLLLLPPTLPAGHVQHGAGGDRVSAAPKAVPLTLAFPGAVAGRVPAAPGRPVLRPSPGLLEGHTHPQPVGIVQPRRVQMLHGPGQAVQAGCFVLHLSLLLSGPPKGAGRARNLPGPALFCCTPAYSYRLHLHPPLPLPAQQLPQHRRRPAGVGAVVLRHIRHLPGPLYAPGPVLFPPAGRMLA